MKLGPALTTAIVAALIVSACSIGRPIPSATTYSIEAGVPAAPLPGRPWPERLRVARVRVAAPYDKASLVYRLSSVRFVSDPYHAFLADPGPMLSSGIVQWLAAAGQFTSVEGPGVAVPTAWVLETGVSQLYGDFQRDADPAAVMSIQFAVVDQTTAHPNVRYEGTITRRVSLARASPEDLVQGYGTAFGQILSELSTELESRLAVDAGAARR